MDREEQIRRQQELVDAARAAGRDLTAEEQAEFDELQRRLDAPEVPAPQPPAPADPPAPAEDAGRQAVEGERRRIADIMELCRQTGMDPGEYIRSGAGVDSVREAAVNYLLRRGAPVNTGARAREGDDFRSACVDALLIQAGQEPKEPARGAEEMRGMSLRDMLIECMSRSGAGSVTSLLRMSRDELWGEAVRQFMSPTADFPAILDEAIRKAIVREYEFTPETFEAWTGRGTLPDFKPSKDHEYVLGGGDFQKVPEGGELKHSTLQTELLPTRKLDTYGTQFTMTRQAFINDDIGFLTEMPGQYARTAKRKINRQVYELLFTNPAIFDGAALFDDVHKNVINEGGKPTLESLTRMITMFGLQTDQFGESIMVQPSTLILPVGWGMLAEQILSTAQIDVEGLGNHTVNVLNTRYGKKLRVLEEGALNVLAGGGTCPWFMASDPRAVKNIQVDYLNGNTSPSFRRSEKAGFLGYIWDIWMDWGVSVRDFRGLACNKGTTLTA